MEMDNTSKRLLSASKLGVTFEYADGHRYINFDTESDNHLLCDMLTDKQFYVNTKIYGDIFDALNFIDFLLDKVGHDNLLDTFNNYNDWGVNDIPETIDYFETRIFKI